MQQHRLPTANSYNSLIPYIFRFLLVNGIAIGLQLQWRFYYLVYIVVDCRKQLNNQQPTAKLNYFTSLITSRSLFPNTYAQDSDSKNVVVTFSLVYF